MEESAKDGLWTLAYQQTKQRCLSFPFLLVETPVAGVIGIALSPALGLAAFFVLVLAVLAVSLVRIPVEQRNQARAEVVRLNADVVGLKAQIEDLSAQTVDMEAFWDALAGFAATGDFWAERRRIDDGLDDVDRDPGLDHEISSWQAMAWTFLTQAFGVQGVWRYVKSYNGAGQSGPLDMQAKFFWQVLDAKEEPRSDLDMKDWDFVSKRAWDLVVAEREQWDEDASLEGTNALLLAKEAIERLGDATESRRKKVLGEISMLLAGSFGLDVETYFRGTLAVGDEPLDAYVIRLGSLTKAHWATEAYHRSGTKLPDIKITPKPAQQITEKIARFEQRIEAI